MSAIPPNNKQTFLTKAKAIVNRTFTEYTGENAKLAIRELQACCSELIRAVSELQDKQVQSRFADVDGFARNASRCELLDGQFLRLTQTAASPQIVSVDHGLRRRPQGALFIKEGNANNQVLIGGNAATNTPPADELRVSFRLNGSVNDVHICILF